MFCLLIFSCQNQNSENTLTRKTTEPTEIKVYDFDKLEPLLYSRSNKVYLINFWAMWCVPCVKELPYIQKFAKNHPEIEVLLISMDFPEDIETKLKPFLKKGKITSEVILLDDPNSNTWIDKIDPNWSGAIPFTILSNKNKRAFYERSFESLEDLEIELLKFTNN